VATSAAAAASFWPDTIERVPRPTLDVGAQALDELDGGVTCRAMEVTGGDSARGSDRSFNVTIAVALSDARKKIRRTHRRHRPGRDVVSRRLAGSQYFSC
jgi:hypothetical protein